MTSICRIRRIEDPTDLMSKMEALKEAVDACVHTFSTQFGMELVMDGMPGVPDPEGIAFGSSIALTNDDVRYQYATVFDKATTESLTRTLFDMEEDEELTLEDIGDALNEIPNMAFQLRRPRWGFH